MSRSERRAVPGAHGRSRLSGPPCPPAGLPADFTVVLDARTRCVDRGRVLIGGTPLRLLRLGERGAALVGRWAAGDIVGDDPAAQALARRLVDSGIAHPSPPLAPATPEVTVVVPVRDQDDHLERLLASLVAYPEGARHIVVVDDGSADPAAVAAVCAAYATSACPSSERRLPHGAPGKSTSGETSSTTGGRPGVHLVRQHHRSGPAAARNHGAALTESEVVVFLDADVEVAGGWLAPLVAHFADPEVGAVAPRVTAPVPAGRRSGLLARYDAARSPLDLGARPAAVHPGSPVAFVPSAALAVRRAALLDVEGFDPSLHIGEDVDLVWRLHAGGWSVRFEPAAGVTHASRPTARAWLEQRFRYGTSAAGLARRHPGALAPVRASWWSVAAWSAPAVGWQPLAPGLSIPSLAALAASATALVASAATLVARLPIDEHRRLEAFRLTTEAHWHAGANLAEALRRPWWPLAVVAAWRWPRARRVVAAAWLVPPCWGWLRGRPPMPILAWVALHLVDDLAYGAGLWTGCLRHANFGPLLPHLSSEQRPRWRSQRPGCRYPKPAARRR